MFEAATTKATRADLRVPSEPSPTSRTPVPDGANERRPIPVVPRTGWLGNLEAFRVDRVGMQLRLAAEYPEVGGLRFGFTSGVIVNAPALAHEVLSTKHDHFVKAPGLTVFLKPLLGNGLLTSEREFHAKQRRLLAPAFTHKRIASYADTMARRGERFARRIEDGESLDISAEMMRLTLEIVGKTLFDAEMGTDAGDVGQAVTTAMECAIEQIHSSLPIPPFIPTPLNLENRRAVAKLDAIIYRLIRERRALDVDRGDVLSTLLEARDEVGRPMPDRQVRDESMTLFLAGHETTANALSWVFYLLAKNPDARARVEAEIDAIGHVPTYADLGKLPFALAVFKEAMRIFPPAYILPRRVVRPVDIGPYRIGRNTLVFVNVLGIHRRPDLFEDPDAFRPERFLGDAEKALPRGAYIPFGGGPRVCIGNHFATMEGHLLMSILLSRLRFDLTSDAEVELEPLVTLRPKNGIPMRATVRRPNV